MPSLIQQLLSTHHDPVYFLVRVVAGIIIFPYGMQKLFGWFEGPGLKGALEQLKERKIPTGIAWLIIIGQSVGSVALIIGFLSRIAAAGCVIIFTGAMITHLPEGWMLNWYGKKKGEGIEYFVMLLAMLLCIIIAGSGPWSLDSWLTAGF